MKTKIAALSHWAPAALLLVAAPALAAEDAPNPPAQPGQLHPAPKDPRGLQAKDLVGTDVYGVAQEKLGALHDLVADARSGKIVFVVVSSGGVLGVGDKKRVVPIEACTFEGDHMAIEVDEARWKHAPLFSDEQLLSLSRADRTREIREFFDQASLDRSPTARDPRVQEAPPQFVLASELRGKDVRGGDRSIGEIDDLVVQMKSRTVAVLFDPHDGFVGNERHYLLPLGKLYGFHTDALTTDLVREDFAGASTSRDDSWASSKGYVDSLYIWPMWPYHVPGGDPLVIFPGPADRNQNGGDRGQAPVEAIRQAVQSEAPDTKNDIRVVTEKNKVILRGTVPSEAVKERVEDRAEKAAAGWDIESQLRVAQTER